MFETGTLFQIFHREFGDGVLTVKNAGGTGASNTGNDFLDEPACPTLRVRLSFPHPRVQHLAGVGSGGQHRAIANFLVQP